MKKLIPAIVSVLLAAAVLSACQKEEVRPVDNTGRGVVKQTASGSGI